MINVKLIGIAPCYNELSKGHLERFFINIPKVVDGLVVLDDASTDGSYEYIKDHTEHVIRNEINRFIFEQDNTQILINEALKRYPDLTHILTLNIDSSFSPATFKDGEAVIHKCLEKYPEYGMWVARNIHLWRSNYWYRSDSGWFNNLTERVYVRSHSLRMLHANRKGLHHGKTTDAPNWGNITNFFEDAVSLHWGFASKQLIEEKVRYYLSKERAGVPKIEHFYKTNVFKLLDEFNLRTSRINESWIDSDIDMGIDIGEPFPISYYSLLASLDRKRADEYENVFIKKLGYHTEIERTKKDTI